MEREIGFNLEKNTPNRDSSFIFENKALSILRQSAIDAINLGIGTLQPKDLRNRIERQIEVNISKSEGYENTSYLSGATKIISITFLETEYINSFGIRSLTPRLDVYIAAIGTNFSKNEVKTSTINESGTIKEWISGGDYQININGLLLGSFVKPTPQNPLAGKPLEDMKKLKEICEAKTSIKVASQKLLELDISRISIDSYNLPDEISDINIQRFSITGSSDSEELTIL